MNLIVEKNFPVNMLTWGARAPFLSGEFTLRYAEL